MTAQLNTIEEALRELASGRMVIVVDDEDRENEGDLICAAQFCSPEIINFMASKARGLICVAITEQRARELNLDVMVRTNTALHGTRFTVSVDYIHGTTTGSPPSTVPRQLEPWRTRRASPRISLVRGISSPGRR
jgi:3,4-dihydroxy 2-butanone 4-phosphate synthase/GTP cyclohydrolase II